MQSSTFFHKNIAELQRLHSISSLTPEDETLRKEIDKINTIPCPKIWYMKYVSNFKRKRGRCETSVVIKEGHLIIKLRVPRLENDIMAQDKQQKQTKIINYLPQRSCGKVMLLHLSVILFTGD